jgi:hypothetical protein
MKRPIQLSLFPLRGFCLILSDGSFAHDFKADLPVFYRTRRAAQRCAARIEGTWIGRTDVRRVEIHPPAEGCNGLPTYLIV